MLPEAVNPLGARIARYYSALWAALLATGCLLLGRGECSGIHRGGGALALPGVFPKKTLDLLDTTAVGNRKGEAVPQPQRPQVKGSGKRNGSGKRKGKAVCLSHNGKAVSHRHLLGPLVGMLPAAADGDMSGRVSTWCRVKRTDAHGHASHHTPEVISATLFEDSPCCAKSRGERVRAAVGSPTMRPESSCAG